MNDIATESDSNHLESGEVAGYLDHSLAPADRSRIEAHAAACDECRAELVEAAWLLRTQPRRRGWYVPAGAVAAAAAAVFLVVWSGSVKVPPGPPDFREPALTTAVAPVVVAPRGVTSSAARLVWTAVPHADRYRLTLFDGKGSVVWETQTPTTSALLPDSIRLLPGALYLWKVEAQTGWNRWVASDLVEFSLGPVQP